MDLRTFLETEFGFGDAAKVEIYQVHFFWQAFYYLHHFMSKEIVLEGDFNLVLDVKEDKNGGLPRTHQNASKIINRNCQDLIYGER